MIGTLSLSHFHDAECIGDLSEQTLFICSLRHLILHKKNALLKSKTKEKKTGADPVSKFQTYENDVAHTKGAGFWNILKNLKIVFWTNWNILILSFEPFETF